MDKKINIINMNSYPRGSLENKAMFLEETLDKMKQMEEFSFKKTKRFPKDQGLKKKLKSVQEGLKEVDQKCNIIWMDIWKIEKEKYKNV